MDPFQDLMSSSVLIMLNKVSVMPCGSCSAEQHCLTTEAGLSRGCHPNEAVQLCPCLPGGCQPALQRLPQADPQPKPQTVAWLLPGVNPPAHFASVCLHPGAHSPWQENPSPFLLQARLSHLLTLEWLRVGIALLTETDG